MSLLKSVYLGKAKIPNNIMNKSSNMKYIIHFLPFTVRFPRVKIYYIRYIQ